MLKNCADGYTMRDTDHNRRIEYDGIIYPSFPGPKHKSIEVGHVRTLVRTLRIDRDCARKYVPI